MEPHVHAASGWPQPIDASTAAVKAHVSRERAPAPGVDNGWRSSAQMYLTPREHRLTMTQALCRYYGYPATAINLPPPRRSGIERHCSSVASAWQKRCACRKPKSSTNFGEYRRFLSYKTIPSLATRLRVAPHDSESRRTTPSRAARLPSLAARLPSLAARLASLTARPPSLTARLPSLTARLPSLAARLPSLAARLPSLAARLSSLAARLPSLAARLPSLAARLPGLAARLAPVILSRRSRGFLRRRTTKDPLRCTKSVLSEAGPSIVRRMKEPLILPTDVS